LPLGPFEELCDVFLEFPSKLGLLESGTPIE